MWGVVFGIMLLEWIFQCKKIEKSIRLYISMENVYYVEHVHEKMRKKNIETPKGL